MGGNKNKNLYYPLVFLKTIKILNNKNIIMKYNKKCIIISIILFVLLTGIIFGIPPLLPVWFVDRYFGVIYIIFFIIFLLVIKYFRSQKCLAVFLTIFVFLIIVFMVYLNGVFAPFIEKTIGETPEAKIELYVRSISEGDEKKALDLWQFPDWWDSSFVGFKELKERREKITNELDQKRINSGFTITRIEWWSTCCMPSVINDSNLANGARVYVQMTDFNNNKLHYIFDVFVSSGYRDPGIENSIRYWTIRDIYPENEEPLFWTINNGI